MSLQGWIVAVAVLAYAAFALLPRRPVGLWLSTLGRLALILAALRLVMTLCGYEMEGLWEWLAWSATLAAGAGLSLCRRLGQGGPARRLAGQTVPGAVPPDPHRPQEGVNHGNEKV